MSKKKIKRFSKEFNINKSQFELDFVDINLNSDMPLFLDSSFIKCRKDEWSEGAASTIISFFDHLLSLITNSQIKEAREIFQNFKEPNETRLGLSKNRPIGKGVGSEKAEAIFKNILKSQAAQTGLLEDLEDCHLFIEGFGPDNLSDMITNIIKLDLINYTQVQAKNWNIPLTPNVATGQYWDKVNLEWTESYSDMIVYKDKPIILVPKTAVVRKSLYSPYNYHQHFALTFLKGENLRLLTPLVQTKLNKKKKTERKFVTKSSIKNRNRSSHVVNGYDICKSQGDKGDLVKFSGAFPREFQKFKTQVLREILLSDCAGLFDNESAAYKKAAARLIDDLKDINPGKDDAGKFQNWAIGAFELLFIGYLSHPKKEEKLHEGRKRVDITFSNYASEKIFHKLQSLEGFPSNYIFIECKNYREDPANVELDQLSGRFSDRRGKLGILNCRHVGDLELLMKRCRDTFLDGRGIIVPLVDADLVDGLKSIVEDSSNSIFEIIEERVRRIRM